VTDQWIWDIPSLQRSNSYTRMQAVIDLYETMRIEEWFRVLGSQWTCCDNIAKHAEWLSEQFHMHPQARLNMMDEDTREAYDRLSDRLTIYRGCYEFNRDGMSWSLSPDIAAGFPAMNRYYHPEEKAYLLTLHEVSKSDVVYVGSRREQEIVLDAHQECYAFADDIEEIDTQAIRAGGSR
jgi:Mg2+ and Co2+ transporter CorA